MLDAGVDKKILVSNVRIINAIAKYKISYDIHVHVFNI